MPYLVLLYAQVGLYYSIGVSRAGLAECLWFVERLTSRRMPFCCTAELALDAGALFNINETSTIIHSLLYLVPVLGKSVLFKVSAKWVWGDALVGHEATSYCESAMCSQIPTAVDCAEWYAGKIS